MAGFEDLIRATVEKQSDNSAEKRAAIYDSSRQALERMLQRNDKLDDAAAKVQRDRLEAAIATIKQDYSRAEHLHDSEPPPPMVDPSPPVSKEPPSGKALHSKEPPAPRIAPSPESGEPEAKVSVPPPQPRLKPDPVPDIVQYGPASLSATRDDGPRAPAVSVADPKPPSDASEGLSATSDDRPPDYEGKALRERRPFAKLLFWAIILAGIGTAVWWAVTFGPALIKAQLDGSVDNPQPRIETGNFVPEGEDGWVSVFSPDANPESIETGDTGRAELIDVEERQVARLASAAEDNSIVRVRVPRGVMETLRGKAVTFEVVLSSEPGNNQQFALYCEFGEMGSCGRKRFRAKPEPESYIFDVLINDTSLQEGEDAFIAINTDIGASGKVLDLYSIRVRSGA